MNTQCIEESDVSYRKEEATILNVTENKFSKQNLKDNSQKLSVRQMLDNLMNDIRAEDLRFISM